MQRNLGWAAALLAGALVVGCSDDGPGEGDGGLDGAVGLDAGAGDAATDDGGGRARCGNGVLEEPEECDEGGANSEDGLCLPDCRFGCGDGRVNAVEACDTAIAEGEDGACPTSCDDPDPCVQSVLTGAACEVECDRSMITAFVAGDGCCPSGATIADDPDCGAVCGNGMLESGELCDTAIAAGSPGACPTACDDGEQCTTDTLEGAACRAQCAHADITAPMNGDGCCPAGATPTNDDDCSASCGNGVLDSGERCDTAIAAGAAGACPTSCPPSGDACMPARLANAGTCDAECRTSAITVPMDGDGCCPAGANANTDADCMPVCGNGVLEMGEECDDGGTMAGDGCDAMCRRERADRTAFRIETLALRAPHLYARVIICADVTSQVNNELTSSLTTADSDGNLGLSIANVFRPLDQRAASTPLEITFPDCTAPASSTTCTLPAGEMPIESTARNQSSGTCLAPRPGTFATYSPAITSATAGTGQCYASDEETLSFDLGGVTITLQNARIGATYSGLPATRLINGLVSGFIDEATANATVIPDSVAVVGGRPLASILPGGTGSCRAGGGTYPSLGPDGMTRGWWFYLNFTAREVPYRVE
ncbi:MAG: hypothetical protein KF729_37015 [Sandaracinaceae bacterium]|nr:hypothetical protein [Sandaracinaceae bacterium]